MDRTVNYLGADNPAAKKVVHFTGTTAIKKGEAVVHDFASANIDDVKAPATAGDLIVGVANEAYAANSAGQDITICIGPGVAEARVDGGTDVAIGDNLDYDLSDDFIGDAEGHTAGTIMAIALEAETDDLASTQGATNTNKVFLLPPDSARVIA